MRYSSALVIPFLMLAGCGEPCSNDVLSSVSSPTGRLRAVVFSRECGATVGVNTQVSVVTGTAQPIDGGNVIILKGKVPLRVRWQSESELIVTGAGSTEEFKREAVVGGVRIRYE